MTTPVPPSAPVSLPLPAAYNALPHREFAALATARDPDPDRPALVFLGDDGRPLADQTPPRGLGIHEAEARVWRALGHQALATRPAVEQFCGVPCRVDHDRLGERVALYGTGEASPPGVIEEPEPGAPPSRFVTLRPRGAAAPVRVTQELLDDSQVAESLGRFPSRAMNDGYLAHAASCRLWADNWRATMVAPGGLAEAPPLARLMMSPDAAGLWAGQIANPCQRFAGVIADALEEQGDEPDVARGGLAELLVWLRRSWDSHSPTDVPFGLPPELEPYAPGWLGMAHNPWALSEATAENRGNGLNFVPVFCDSLPAGLYFDPWHWQAAARWAAWWPVVACLSSRRPNRLPHAHVRYPEVRPVGQFGRNPGERLHPEAPWAFDNGLDYAEPYRERQSGYFWAFASDPASVQDGDRFAGLLPHNLGEFFAGTRVAYLTEGHVAVTEPYESLAEADADLSRAFARAVAAVRNGRIGL